MFENIIFWAGYVALWAAVVRYDIHMFQHNSYRVERYARWYRSNSNILRSVLIAFLVALSFIPVYKGAVLTAIAVAMFCEAWHEFRAKYKKPLVYTMRVKRMIISSALLSAAVIATAICFVPAYAPAIALGLLVMPVIMLLANLINKPLEAAISRWYYNDAKRILRSMPSSSAGIACPMRAIRWKLISMPSGRIAQRWKLSLLRKIPKHRFPNGCA